MPKRTSKSVRSVDELTPTELDRLWSEWKKYHASRSTSDIVANALSGDDEPAARSLLHWAEKQLRLTGRADPEVRDYLVRALERFHGPRKVTLGAAFGLERTKTGKPTRAGIRDAVRDLIQFLHERGYTLGLTHDGRSAFEVASLLIKRHWNRSIMPKTLSGEQYWLRKKTRD
jgi:hypothetical protein